MPVNVVDLKRRLETQMSGRGTIDQTWDEVEKWVGPLAGGTDPLLGVSEEGGIQWTRGEVWDSTAPVGASRLAASLYTNLTNPALRWIRLEWTDKDLQNDTEAAKALDDATDQVFNALAESDFYTEVAAFFQDWVRFCTAAIVVEPKYDAMTADQWRGMDFTAPPIRECYYEPDSAGAVYRFWRVLQWTPTQILHKFGEKGTPTKIREQAAKGEESKAKIRIAYSVFVREEWLDKPEREPPLAPELRPVGSCYFVIETGEMLGEEGGFYDMPVFVVPWERAAGSIWGHGPGIQCLPDVRYLNNRLAQQRAAGEKAVDPSIAVTERGLVGDPDLRPGGMVVVRRLEDVKPFESTSRFDVGEHDIADLRAQIRGHFWTDELTLKLSPQMTATEVNARIDQMNRLFGPTLASLESMGIDPLVKTTVETLIRVGKIRFPPRVAQKVNAMKAKTGKVDYAIKYQGPLSRAQRSDEVAAIERTASAASAMLKMGFEEIRFCFNPQDALREIAKRLGTPANILYSEKDAKAKAQEAQDLARRAAEAEVAKNASAAARDQAQAQAVASGGNGVPTSVPAQPPPLLVPPVE